MSTISSISSTPVTSTPTATSSSSGTATTGQAILTALGVGSSIPLASLLSSLMSAASIPLTQLQSQVTNVNTEISAYGTLNSALASFQDSLTALASPLTYQAGTGSLSNSTVLTAAVGLAPTLGIDNINVTQLAQAQSLTSAGQASTSTSIGSGASSTLTITLGTTTGTAANGTYGSGTTFTANPNAAPVNITIDSSNNTLDGIVTAINSANAGVTASIVSDGSSAPDRLVLTSNATGAAQSMNISVSGDSTLKSLLSFDPTSTTGQSLTQGSAAQDAALTINGLAVTAPTNTVSAITGVTLKLASTGSTTLTVSNDTSSIQSDIDSFVTAYNTAQSAISTLTAYNAASGGTNGPLIGDTTTTQIQSQLQAIVANGLSGVASGGLSSLSQIGVTFNTTGNGQLEVNDTTLSNALSTNLSQFQALFATAGSATNSAVTYGGGTSATQPGTYAINITQAATQSTATGTAPAILTGTTASQLNLTLDGHAATVSVPGGPYASAAALATAVQTAINSNSVFQGDGLTATVQANPDGSLTLASSTYGATSSVSVAGSGAAALFGSASIAGTVGLDVQGTIGGVVATGSGQLLTAATGPAAGLLVQVSGNATGSLGTVSYSTGYASQLNKYITGVTASTGSIAAATTALNTQITGINQQETQMQTYLTGVQANYTAEFTALQTALAKMQNTSQFLTQMFDPTTSSN